MPRTTTGECGGRPAGISGFMAALSDSHRLRDPGGEDGQLADQGMALRPEPLPEERVAPELGEGPYLALHSDEPFTPGQGEKPRRDEQREEEEEARSAGRLPDQPALADPRERVEDQTGGDLVGGLLLGGAPEPAHDRPGQGIGHDVTEDAPEGQRQGDGQAGEIPERGPEDDPPGERTVELVAREPRLVQADAVALDAATELCHP